MPNQPKTSRRSYILAALSGTAAIAGCNTQTKEKPTKSTNTTPAGTNEEEIAENNTKDQPTQDEFEQLLDAALFNLSEDLSSQAHRAPYGNTQLIEKHEDDDQTYWIDVNEDFGQILKLSNGEYDDPDLYVAAQFGLLDEVIADASSQLSVTANFVESGLQEVAEVADELGYNVHVDLDLYDGHDNNVGPSWEINESIANEEIDQFYRSASESGFNESIGGLASGDAERYEDKLMVSTSNPATLTVDGQKHTIEYLTTNDNEKTKEGVMKVDGELVSVDEYGEFSIGSRTAELDEANPIYAQDRKEVEDGAVIDLR